MSKGLRKQTECKSNVKSKEDEYRCINEQLEAKTAQLLKEANEVMVHNAQVVNSIDNPYKEEESGDMFSDFNHEFIPSVDLEEYPVQTGDFLDSTRGKERCENNESVPVINDKDIIPEAVTSLSLKAQTRYLKAKVKVLMEENQKLNSELSHRNEEIVQLKNRIQELEDERNRLHRVTTTHSSQLEKIKKSLGETRTYCDTLEAEKNSFKKDGDAAKKTIDQQTADIKSLTTRLNRATEEADRYKAELEKIRSTTRENTDSMRHNIERLTTENRRLEKQKSELITAFKKQMKLIDVLRRQKMLIEASKCLQITEEQFLKSLE